MEILILLAILTAVTNLLVLQVWLLRNLRTKQSDQSNEQLTPEELEARRLVAEAQAKYEQGFVNIMCYDGMPAGKKEAML